MDQLKVAIIGAGKRAQEYMRVLTTMSDQFRLVAVCSDNQAFPDGLADFTDVSTYSDGEALFANHQIDLGVVASDPMKVHDDSIKVLEHDVHLLSLGVSVQKVAKNKINLIILVSYVDGLTNFELGDYLLLLS